MSLKNRLFSLFIFLFLIGNVHAQNKGINSSLAYEQITAQPIVLDGGEKRSLVKILNTQVVPL